MRAKFVVPLNDMDSLQQFVSPILHQIFESKTSLACINGGIENVFMESIKKDVCQICKLDLWPFMSNCIYDLCCKCFILEGLWSINNVNSKNDKLPFSDIICFSMPINSRKLCFHKSLTMFE